jgi:2-aminoadipate transaminase
MSEAPVKTISFARGAPSLDIIDVEGLKASAQAGFDADPAGMTAYGTSVGYLPLRAWIAEKHGVAAENVIVTNGSMQADAFLFDTLVTVGEPVITELPTYDRTLLSLRERGADVRMVELQQDGIDVAVLESLLTAGLRPTFAHIIPNFQNPAGYTLSLEKRHRLIALAREFGFVIFEDDPYVELRFHGDPLPTMVSLDPENVVYASSFSKTVAPGSRTGYLVGPRKIIAQIEKLATSAYIAPNMIAQGIINQFARSGAIERSIQTVKTALSERATALADALERELPDACFTRPEGGYFMWVTLPAGTDVGALFEAAKARGVLIVKGTDFVLEGYEASLRLAYSGVTPEEIEEGVSRLADAYHEVTAGAGASVV